MQLLEQAKQAFNSLEKREQWILLVGAAFVLFYLIYGVFYRGLVEDRNQYETRVIAAEETLAWMNTAVKEIKSAGQGSRAGSSFSNKSLSQLSEYAAQKSQLRVSRFQPKGNDKAQVWFDKVDFDALLDFLSRLELDYGLIIEDLSVTSNNEAGQVNARITFAR